MWDEFKAFISRGNVIELAVAIIIGTAFNKVINSIVNDIVMPPLGFAIKGIDFKELKFKFGDAVSINYGNCIQNLIEFFIIAFATFLLIKAINKLHIIQEQKQTTPPPPTPSENLLMEIRDLLKNKGNI